MTKYTLIIATSRRLGTGYAPHTSTTNALFPKKDKNSRFSQPNITTYTRVIYPSHMGPADPQTPPMEPVDANFRIPTPPTPRFAPIDEPDELWLSKNPPQPQGTTNAKKHLRAGRSHTVPSCMGQSTPHRGSNHSSGSKSYSHVAPNVLITPEATPARKKRRYEDVNKSSRVLFPAKHSIQGKGRSDGAHRPQKDSITILHEEPSFLGKMKMAREQPQPHHQDQGISESETDIDVNVSKTLTHDPGTPVIDSDDETSTDAEDTFDEPISTSTVLKTYTEDTVPANLPGMWYTFRGKKVFRPFANAKQAADMMSIKPKRLFGSAPTNMPPKKNPFISRLEGPDEASASTTTTTTTTNDTDSEHCNESSDELLEQLRRFRDSRGRMRYAFR